MNGRKLKVLVISSNYPGPDHFYGDVFVHTRLKHYKREIDVEVVGFNPRAAASKAYEHEGIEVSITNHLEEFVNVLQSTDADVVIGHFVQREYLDALGRLRKPVIIFIHGYEALSWRRRLMNYVHPGDLRYLVPYIFENRKQVKALKEFARGSESSNISFVFVSQWLKKAVEQDWGFTIRNSYIIPNGVDMERFQYRKKDPGYRKKILILRSFSARNYANDLAVEAILLLSKKRIFHELQFTIYGEGYLFSKLTRRLSSFANVKLENKFVPNAMIPEIHALHGIFLCPSRLDTQGVSMCEAMSSGLVPITSPVGGIPEYAEDRVSSFQVKTAKEIAEKIEYLVDHPEIFAAMSQQANEGINKRCKVSDTVQAEINLIKSVSGNSPGEYATSYRQCTRCVLDTNDDPKITFDEHGVCSYCRSYDVYESRFVKRGTEGEAAVKRIVEDIKRSGRGKAFDCIIGISGGVDSTYLALVAKKLGLRPLVVHFDNGWNSELAVSNIENIVSKLGFELHTFVVDWEEFKDIQLSFLKSSVVDIEMVTDHAIITQMYKFALQYDIKYILSGTNVVTEFILPQAWIHNKKDHVNIKAIQKQFGTKPLKTYPLFTSFLKWRCSWAGIKSISLLDYLPYNKEDAKTTIARELGWRDYGGKHYESIFTRFFQGYILPVKFNVDKRKAHLSNLICSGQITREQALEELKVPGYSDEQRSIDHEFVLKKLGLTESDFKAIMDTPPRRHNDFQVEEDIYTRFPLLRPLRGIWYLIRNLRQKDNIGS